MITPGREESGDDVSTLTERYGRRAAGALLDLADHEPLLARVTAGGKEVFMGDVTLMLAGEALLIRCGEAAHRALSAAPEVEDELPALELRRLKNARNFIAHGYDSIDHDLLWEILSDHLPRVLAEVKHLVSEQ